MTRSPNFFYQGNPGAEIGNGLARAIWGDPEAAARQREALAQEALRRSQIAEHEARTGLLGSQTERQVGQNAAAASLPELIARMQPQALPPQPPIPSISDPAFLDGAGPSPAA